MTEFQTLAQDVDKIARWAGTIALALLSIGCILVLLPFLPSILWASILVFATWPLFVRLEHALGGHKLTASLLMTAILATSLVLPLVLVGSSIANGAENLIDKLRAAAADPLANPIGPPDWLTAIPWIGPWIGEWALDYWQHAIGGTESLIEAALPVLNVLRESAIRSGLTIGRGFVELSLSVLISFFLYRDGLSSLDTLRNIVRRIAGEKALTLIGVAGATTTGVVYGIIGTALAQGALAVFGFWLAGVPAPVLLGTLTFFLALFPFGAPFVWFPAALWLFGQGSFGWGVFMLIWGAAGISGIDNFLRPYLISRGTNLPFLLVLFGVVGGILTFGVLGIFIGPTLLAIAMALLQQWRLNEPHGDPIEPGDTGRTV